ncbi:MAG: RDD family protein [Candidatus Acidiferrales bacterium]
MLEDSESCSFCDNPLAENVSASEQVPVGVSAAASAPASAEEPEWRREVSRRLEQYRARRRRLNPDDSQSGLPFSAEIELEEEVRDRPRPRLPQRQRQPERMEINIQPELDFSSALDDRAHPQTALVPVADLAARRQAGLLDAIFLALTYAGFLGLFRSLGGQLTFEKMDSIVYLICFYLLYAQYFFLFTTFAGATPGMQLRCLTIVRLDGTLPDTRQLLWRSFGYLLSGATLMLGYLWSLWDEDHFTWQDRISQTYITAAAPIADSDPFEVRAVHHTFAHK